MRKIAIIFVFAACYTAPAIAQSAIDRTPNIDDGWTVPPGVVQFNFLHRFTSSGAPARKVTSFPSFHLATGLPRDFNLGLIYSTNSQVFAGIPNEYEVTLRRPIIRQVDEHPFDATLTGGYNTASQSVDGELVVARSFGRLKVLEIARGISSGYNNGRALFGFGGGATFRIGSALSVGGDYFRLSNLRDNDAAAPAWGISIASRIPYTPHSLSIQVTNTPTSTIEGSSKGLRNQKMVGFEFTIPVTLGRYFRHSASPTIDTADAPDSTKLRPAGKEPAEGPIVTPSDAATPRVTTANPSAPLPAPTVAGQHRRSNKDQSAPVPGSTPVEKKKPSAAPSVTIRIMNLSFRSAVVHVQPGTRVRWVNGDQVEHSVTSDKMLFDSRLIQPGKAYERVFGEPGRYTYHCVPHPFMKAVIVVDAEPSPPK